MNFSTIIGIDVSKLTLDLHVLPNNQDCQTKNDEKGFKEIVKWLAKVGQIDLSATLFSFENTGFYSYKLSLWLQDKGYRFVMLSGLELKRSLGISRGKSDEIDALKIAEYTFLRRDSITQTILPEQDIIRMKRLLSLRNKLIRQRSGFMATLREAKRAFSRKEDPLYYKIQEDLLKKLSIQIERIEKELHQIIENNSTLKEQYHLILSIKGAGPIAAFTFIAITHGFQKFQTWRKFACYAGIAPFPYRSGTSIMGRNKVSHLANKKIKSLLSNMAVSAVQHNTELKLYYNRRLDDGKNKSSTLNIIKNKLVARIFAVIERGTPYVNTAKFAA